MAYTPEQITHVAESMYFDMLTNFFGFSFEEEYFQILHNINTLDRIQMGLVEAWEMNGRRGLWKKCIDRKKARRCLDMTICRLIN